MLSSSEAGVGDGVGVGVGVAVGVTVGVGVTLGFGVEVGVGVAVGDALGFLAVCMAAISLSESDVFQIAAC